MAYINGGDMVHQTHILIKLPATLCYDNVLKEKQQFKEQE